MPFLGSIGTLKFAGQKRIELRRLCLQSRHSVVELPLSLALFTYFSICLFIYLLCMSVLPECMCMSDALSYKNGVLGPLELVLQVVVSCHVDAGKWTQVLCKSRKCS